MMRALSVAGVNNRFYTLTACVIRQFLPVNDKTITYGRYSRNEGQMQKRDTMPKLVHGEKSLSGDHGN